MSSIFAGLLASFVFAKMVREYKEEKKMWKNVKKRKKGWTNTTAKDREDEKKKKNF